MSSSVGRVTHEALELAVLGERPGGQLVEHAVGSSVSSDDLARRSRGSGSRSRACRRSARRAGRRRRSRPSREDGDAVGELLGLVEVVRREQDRLAELPQRADRLPGGARACGSKPVVGSSRKISSGSPTAPSPRSSRRRWPPESVRTRASRFSVEADELDDLVDRRAAAGSSRRRARGSRRRVRVGYIADDWRTTPIRSRQSPPALRRVDAEHLDLARVALAVALEDLDRRRLAGAVRAEQAEDLAALRSRS